MRNPFVVAALCVGLAWSGAALADAVRPAARREVGGGAADSAAAPDVASERSDGSLVGIEAPWLPGGIENSGISLGMLQSSRTREDRVRIVARR